MSYGSAVTVPSRSKTQTKQKRPARNGDGSNDEDAGSSSDDEPPKLQMQKQKRKAIQSSSDSDDPASSGDERRKKQSAKARKTGGSSRKVREARSKPRKSSKKRQVSTEEDNSGSSSSTDDRGYTNKSQGAQKKRRNKWADANGRENMTKRERNRKPGGRVTKSGAFPGKGHSLIAVDDLSDDVSTYRRRTGSRKAREARAIAAESRTSVAAGTSRSTQGAKKSTSKKRAKVKPRESSDDEAPKMRKKTDTDSEDIDEDSDRPTVKRKSVFDFSDPELRALIGGNDSDSQVDQLQDSSDEDLPTLRHVALTSQKSAHSQPIKRVKKDVPMKAAEKGKPKSAPVVSGSGRSWTASRDHRDAPVPVKQKRPEQRFFSNAEIQKRHKENLAISASDKRAAAAKRKAANTIEIDSGDESDDNDTLPPRLSQSSNVPSRLKPIKAASKPQSRNTKVIDITDSEAESDSDFD